MQKGTEIIMKVTYIEHSGFLLEMPEVNFLFDYYRGSIPQLSREKTLVVFVSHRHHDHYNPAIFEWIREYPNIRYVLSKDVPIKQEMMKYKEQGIDLGNYITIAAKREIQMLDISGGKHIRVETLKSTDEGVAFLLEYEGRTIYHAGDLNLWVWEEESRQYNENMTKKYFAELDKLKGRTIDIAFVPLDPRQEKDAYGGMESFLKYIETGLVFPMHFWEKYEIIDEFMKEHPEYANRVKRIEHAGQSFE